VVFGGYIVGKGCGKARQGDEGTVTARAAPIKSIDVQMVAAGGTPGNTAARYV